MEQVFNINGFELSYEEHLLYWFYLRQIKVGYFEGDDNYERKFDFTDKTKQYLYALAYQTYLKLKTELDKEAK